MKVVVQYRPSQDRTRQDARHRQKVRYSVDIFTDRGLFIRHLFLVDNMFGFADILVRRLLARVGREWA